MEEELKCVKIKFNSLSNIEIISVQNLWKTLQRETSAEPLPI